jgi:hypothetical protein
MVKNSTAVNEEQTQVPDHDANGMGSMVPGPVATGDAHRPQDNTTETDADVAIVQGQPIPRSALLRALVATLQGMDQVALDRIANEVDAMQDVNIDPANSVPDLQGTNLASIAVKEDIEEIFAGEDTLTEEFKAKTALVFEAAVGARVAVVEAEMREAQEAQVSEAVEAVTEQLVDQLDRYISFAAENFVTENAPVLEQTIRSVAAEKFLEGVITLAEQFNVDMPQAKVDVVEELSGKIEGLETRLNEAIEDAVNAKQELKVLQMKEVFEEVSAPLTTPQRDRLRTLSENVSIDGDIETYRVSLKTLSESVGATTARKPIVEDTDNGVLLNEGTEIKPILNKTDEKVFDVLGRMGR